MQETQVLSLGQEDPLDKGMATYSSIHAWRIPWTEEPGGLQAMESQRAGHNWATNAHTHTHICVCLENLLEDTKWNEKWGIGRRDPSCDISICTFADNILKWLFLYM